MIANDDVQPEPFADKRLAKNLSTLWESGSEPTRTFDVVIVGSGYGGSVAASSLAQSSRPLSVCVLERGREYLPGEFPSTFDELPGHLRAGQQNTGDVVGNREGLFDVRMGDDVVALVANGLGGGSLINAGVMLEPDVQGLRNEALRKVLDGDEGNDLFRQARRMLGAEVRDGNGWKANTIDQHPDWKKKGRLAKTVALNELATASHQTASLTPITVALETRPNHAGVNLNECSLCGDCMTGCNVGAKDSLDVNLLREARAGNVEIFTGATVLSMRRSAPQAGVERHWVLRVAHTDAKLQQRESRLLFIKAHKVVLAAGALGSTEILLRSRDDLLVLSPRLGEGFSCNGDNLAAAHDLARPTKVGAAEDDPLVGRHVGPTITATIDVAGTPGAERFQVQEFSVPAPMKRLFDEIVTTANVLHSLPKPDTTVHGNEEANRIDPLAVHSDRMDRTLLVGVIGHDSARGSLRLANPIRPPYGVPQEGALNIYWPQARSDIQLDRAHDRLVKMVEKMPHGGGVTRSEPTLVANPMWRLLPPALESLVSQPRGPVLTVHPLGGCGMGRRAEDGVVDDLGRVFNEDRNSDDQWFGSLIVLDGSIIPQSLGVNPALTITALALRAMKVHCAAWGAQAAQDDVARAPSEVDRPMLVKVPVPPANVPSPKRTEIEIVERLRGPVALDPRDPQRQWMVELTLAYKPLPVASLMSTLARGMDVDPSSRNSRLRLYAKSDWTEHELHVATDAERAKFVQAEVRIRQGTLSLLHREASTPFQRRWRSFVAWFWNRGLRDTWQSFSEPSTGRQVAHPAPRGPMRRLQELWRKLRSVLVKLGTLGSRFRELWDLASHAGEVRRFDYDVELGEVVLDNLKDGNHKPLAIALEGQKIEGHKRLTYDRRANPWQQLTKLTLTRMPAMEQGASPVLDLDLRFLVGQGVPLLQIHRQRNQAHALAELASFALHLTRILLSIHLWTFRKPDTPSIAEPVRLPGSVQGLPEPIITELLVDRAPETGAPVKVRLTRYPASCSSDKPALVMIHGYSVSGTTFTHPSLSPSAVQALWRHDREVWVVDLRTSSGMPTAMLPWSMEQPALIDIPAALLHIRKATGRPVDVLAHCIGCAMLSMAILTDARWVRSSETQLGVASWLTSEHLGTLTAFNGTRTPGGQHPCIRTVVLSQKGPVLHYTDGNVFRAFLMQYARRWLLRDDYQFRRSTKPSVSEDLLDRLLSSVPYPPSDYDIENPVWPWATRPWTASRHRMDALYGRDFSADNMSEETRRAIDDLFGPLNLDTVAQTIHFARFNAITNQRGRGEFVTRQRLYERWSGIPTMLLHGADNGLADASTQRLLERALKSAGVPCESPTPYPGMGHQDVLIGLQSERVFADIDKFLSKPLGAAGLHDATAPPSLVCEAPWIGPRIDRFADEISPRVRVACKSRPDQGNSTLFLVPASWDSNTGEYVVLKRPELVFGSEEGSNVEWLFAEPELSSLVTLPDNGVFGWLALLVYPVGETTSAVKVEQDAAVGQAAAQAPRAGTANAARAPTPTSGEVAQSPQATPISVARPPSAVFIPAPDLIRALEQWRPGSSHVIGQPSWYSHHAEFMELRRRLLLRRELLGTSKLNVVGALSPAFANPSSTYLGSLSTEHRLGDAAANGAIGLAEDWLKSHRRDMSAVDMCFIRRDDLQRADRSVTEGKPAERVRIGLASCQYPQGLLDKPSAQSSLRAMSQDLATLDGVLFVGDQIYADATAGLVDPARRDELYDHPHDNALRLQALRKVHRRVPSYFLLDDHELSDNWEPLSDVVASERPQLKKKMNEVRRNGLRAFQTHQRMRHEPNWRSADEPADAELSIRGYPVRLLDTRTGRSPRGSTVLAKDVSILRNTQWLALEAWLLKHKTAVKFLATPSVVLPRRRDVAENVGHDVRSDSWDGFPASLSRLLSFIVDNGVHNTVFLSGDEHHAFHAEISVQRAGKPDSSVKLVSIHTSALHAPFPFANGRADDFPERDEFEIAGLEVKVQTTFAPPGDGYVVVEVEHGGGQPTLSVSYQKALGGAPATHALAGVLSDQPASKNPLPIVPAPDQ